MKKKIIAIALVLIMLCANCTFAVYGEENNLADIAKLITDDTYIDGVYNAKSNKVTVDQIKVYDANGNQVNIKELIAQNKIDTEDSCLTTYTENNADGTLRFQLLNYTVNLDDTNLLKTTVEYKDALTYNGKTYNVKINVDALRESVAGISSSEAFLRIAVARKNAGSEEYNDEFMPQLGVYYTNNNNGQADYIHTDYSIVDDNGNEVPINGVFGINDIDFNQGVEIKDYKVEEGNVFMASKDVDTIKYKYDSANNETYIYSSTSENLTKNADAYILIEQKSKINLIFKFGGLSAYSNLKFEDGIIKRYNKIITEVENGNITPTVTHKKDGESETISYSPDYKDRQYLVSVTVDGVAQDITKYESSYKFENIQEDHKIKVVYANKYVVTFDTKGGTANPKDQYVMPNERATEPANPTKTGYQFDGWKIKGSTSNTKYDFTTPVTQDTDLEAIWKAVPYKIIYHIDEDTKNNDKNPTEYTVEKTEKFENPTKPGYDFKGWYLDEEYTNPISDTTGRTGDLNLYPKWEASKDTAYKVEHYKQKEDGTYEKVITDELTGTTGEKVTATPKEYRGYTENKTHKERIAEGTIAPDGSLVLKLYYDLDKYKIDYELDGGANNAKNPSEYTVEKTEEFVDPTKQGYDFKGWYLDEEFTKPISTTYGYAEDLKLYAKWEASKDTVYKVEHYTKNDKGEYVIYATDSLAGTTGEKITAVAKKIDGYTENTTHKERVSEGIIAPDGSLVLKLYYDKVPVQLPATGEEPNGGNTSNVIAITTAGVVLVAAVLFRKKYKDLKNI